MLLPRVYFQTKDSHKRGSATRWVGVVLAAGLALCLASCSSGAPSGSSPSTSSGDGAATGNTIVIQNFAFSPKTLTVRPGTTVTVDNKDSVTHTLTSVSGVFNTMDVSAGSSAHFVAPSKAGTYSYRCNIHQYMTGTLVVSSS
jgi:plastocyanin